MNIDQAGEEMCFHVHALLTDGSYCALNAISSAPATHCIDPGGTERIGIVKNVSSIFPIRDLVRRKYPYWPN